MADRLTAEQRSRNMSKIRSKNTKPEIIVRKFLFSNGFRFKLHDKKLPGKPDIVLPKYKTVVFVNGCFWHGHCGCKYYRLPKSNVDYWKPKIEMNISRDIINKEQLEMLGWQVLIVWECQLKKDQTETTLSKLIDLIKFNNTKKAE